MLRKRTRSGTRGARIRGLRGGSDMHRESEQQARREAVRHEATVKGGTRSRPAPGMSPADVARRAELSRHLPPGEFPADRDGLLAHLRRKKAPASVIETI